MIRSFKNMILAYRLIKLASHKNILTNSVSLVCLFFTIKCTEIMTSNKNSRALCRKTKHRKQIDLCDKNPFDTVHSAFELVEHKNEHLGKSSKNGTDSLN